MGTVVGKNEREGRPGVRGAHVQRISRFGADLPGGVEVVQIVVFVDCACGVRVMVGEGFVDDAVENNAPGGGRHELIAQLHQQLGQSVAAASNGIKPPKSIAFD